MKSHQSMKRTRSKQIRLAAVIGLILVFIVAALPGVVVSEGTTAVEPTPEQTTPPPAATETTPETTVAETEAPAPATAEPPPATTAETVPVTVPPTTAAPTAVPEAPAVFILLGDMSVTSGDAGSTVALILPLLNWGNTDLTNVLVTPVLSPDSEAYPFAIERTDYSVTLDKPLVKTLNPADRLNNVYPVQLGQFTIRSDAKSGYYRVACKIRYQLPNGPAEEVERFLYVRVQNGADGKDPGQAPPLDPGYSPGSFSPGFSLGGSGARSVPRLITTGFTTTPGDVYGGTNFTLHLKIKNTSDKTAVSNIRMILETSGEEPTFLPQSGSATSYIKTIGKESEIALEIPLAASSSLQQKTYPLTVKFEYEDAEAMQHTASETISIPVFQKTRLDVGKIEIMPQEVSVGREANVVFSIFNKGKSRLFNVSVLIEDDGPLAEQEVFLGNIDSGSIKDVDMMAAAVAPHDGSPIPLTIRYEDSEGHVDTVEQTISLTITAAVPDGPPEPPPGDPFATQPGLAEGTPGPETPFGLTPLQIGLIAGGGLVLVTAVSLIVRRRRRRRKLALLDDDANG